MGFDLAGTNDEVRIVDAKACKAQKWLVRIGFFVFFFLVSNGRHEASVSECNGLGLSSIFATNVSILLLSHYFVLPQN